MKRGRMSAQSIARFGLLAAMALMLGYVERFIPVAPGVPGIKLGLSNTVLLYAIYMLSFPQAVLLMVVKVLMSGFLFAGASAMLYAFAGGALSLAVMIPLSRVKSLSIVGVSAAGAVAHNIGQLLVAALVVQTRALLLYLPVLLISGAVTGVLTGLVAMRVIAVVGRRMDKPKKDPPERTGD